MKIQKKKFQMDMPDPKKSGLSPNAAAFQKNQLNVPSGNRNAANGSALNRDSSRGGLNRDGSANRLVEDKYLGPSIMKIKGDGSNKPRPMSKMKLNTAQKEREQTNDYSDEDYEEGFDDANDDGLDEMEKIRNAMAKEKEKAKNHALKMNQKREKSQMENR